MNGKMICAYGGGVNTIAMLVLLRLEGIVPTAIVMSDPGHEHAETIRYRDVTMRAWCEVNHFPPIVVVTRWDEIKARSRFKNVETLGELCERTEGLPSVAYGWKRCSFNFKRAPSVWWAERQDWCHREWDAGRKIVKAIGYDAGEDKRARDSFDDPVENRRYVPSYPLRDAGLDRAGCIEVIRAAGLPIPPKSACTFCPNNTLAEWAALRNEEPAAFAYAIEMSRRAFPGLQNPRSTGLMRCNRDGSRQLHIWNEGGYGDLGNGDGEVYEEAADLRDATPCECAL